MSLKRKAADLAKETGKKTKPNASITSFFGAPKPKAGESSTTTNGTGTATATSTATPTTTQANFDKDAWVANLSDEQKELLDLEIKTLDDSWLPYLKDVLVSAQFLELKRFLAREIKSGQTIYPKLGDVYSWSRHTPLNTVKAVILGQDPYHGPNQAHGLCFSVLPPTPAPPSLKNVYIALKKDYPDFKEPPNRGGLLTPWADRGVLLINTCLTVRQRNPDSHAGKGWETLMQKVIDTVAKVRSNGVVFLAWGKSAEGRVKGINAEKHLVLKSVHPSPYSANRGFFDCHHFVKTNDWLVQRYGKDAAINWNLNVDPEEAGK